MQRVPTRPLDAAKALQELLATTLKAHGRQAAFARAAGVEANTVNDWVKGKYSPAVNQLGRIAHGLSELDEKRISVADLFASVTLPVKAASTDTTSTQAGVHGADQADSLQRQIADRDQTIRALRIALSAHAKELKELSGKLGKLADAARPDVRSTARRKPQAG